MTRIRRLLLLLAFTSCLPQPADATNSYCAVIERTSDNFVSLRNGSGVAFSERGRAMLSDLLWIATERCRDDFGLNLCDERGKWVFVEEVVRSDRALRSGVKGWAKASLIRQVACADE